MGEEQLYRFYTPATVKELIEVLQQADPDAEVYYFNHDTYEREDLEVCIFRNNKVELR